MITILRLLLLLVIPRMMIVLPGLGCAIRTSLFIICVLAEPQLIPQPPEFLLRKTRRSVMVLGRRAGPW